MDEHEKIKLEDFVKMLKTHKGMHTELVSVYIPAGYSHTAVSKQLEAEKSTAKNIKSTVTRNNVTDALERIVRFLKGLDKTPENGLVVFCGNVSQTEGQDDIQIWSLEPPMALNIRLYRCDKEFIVEPLEEMLEVTEVYGLLVMDRKEATIGLLEGKRIKMLEHMTSGVPSKVRAGGQCLAPDSWVSLNKINKNLSDLKINESIRALNIKNNKIIFTKVKNKWETTKDKILKIFLEDEESIICSLDHTFFVKDSGKIKKIFAENLEIGNILVCSNNYDILELKITNIKERKGKFRLIDIETEIGNFFANGFLVHNSSQRFHRITEGLTKEFYKRISDRMKEIFFDMPKLKGIIVGGPIPTKDEWAEDGSLVTKLREKIIGLRDIGDADEAGLKELVAKSQDLLSQQESIMETKLLQKFFEALSRKPGLVVYGYNDVKKALEYGAVETLIISKKVKKEFQIELEEMAKNISANIEIVSTETEEGQQFFNISGIGALLRFGI